MASINDLATAATVALQSSPKQEPAVAARPAQSQSQSTPPSGSPTSPRQNAGKATPASGKGTASEHSRPEPEDGDSITVATGAPPPPVLAAPHIEPQNAVQAQIPAPPPATPPAGDGDGDVEAAGNGGVEAKEESTAAGDAMDGVEKEGPPATPVRGAFIVFEGMDRAGKTTQAKLLQQRCIESGREVRFMRFPGECCG